MRLAPAVSMVVLSVAALAACSSSSSSGPAASGTGGAGGGAADLLAAPAEGQGIQYRMVTSLTPGLEVERCQFFQVGAEPLYVKRQDVRYSPGSHHVLLYSTPYKAIPTVDIHGNTADTTGVIDCVSGAAGDWNIDRVIGGAQSANAPAIIDLPDGVAMVIPAGTVVLLNTHYLNTTPGPLDVDARINLYTVAKETVKQEAGIIFFYNPFISVPAHGKGTARMICPVKNDITMVNVQSHMHRRGVGYEANVVDGTGAMMEQMYSNTKWEGVPVKQWEGGHQLKAGTFLDYHCDYQSDVDNDIFQGLTTKDEMCMLIGSYYPKDENFEVCADANGARYAPAKWVGNGTKSCLDGLLCMQKGGGHIDPCVTDVCPSAANEMSDVLKCFLGGGNGMCDAECKDQKSKPCGDCLQAACKPAIDVCIAKSCELVRGFSAISARAAPLRTSSTRRVPPKPTSPKLPGLTQRSAEPKARTLAIFRSNGDQSSALAMLDQIDSISSMSID